VTPALEAPFGAWAGPRDARTVFVGEAFGEQEALVNQPLVGASGKEFWAMLGDAWGRGQWWQAGADRHRWGAGWHKHRGEYLIEHSLAFTNVFNLRPPGNKLQAICETKKENKKAEPRWQLERGHYLRAEFHHHPGRLLDELLAHPRNLVVLLGNTACWALLQQTNIGQIRGAIRPARLRGEQVKTLPTYHPAGVMRQWGWRTIVVADLMKARREAGFPEIRRPRREVIINPSIEDIDRWIEETPAGCRLAVDIETGRGQIKCIGFARSATEALVIPFVDPARANRSYWPTLGDELVAWELVEILLRGSWPKVFQNGLYDIQWLARQGLQVAHCADDTMLLHHSLFPEMQKGLGFLGSIYSSEAAWKLMRKEGEGEEMLKKDE
jgi:uracil-DNA glycosylase